MTAHANTSDLAPLSQSFFADKLMRQRQASPNTIATYRDAFTLLLGFASPGIRRQSAQLGLGDLEVPRFARDLVIRIRRARLGS